MRWSRYFIPTLKENPQEAEAASHKLMVRAGLIRRLSAGAYTYLPLGCKVLKKAENIVREEMTKAGAIEILMPALQPVELWKKTGRYDVIGEVMIKFKDRHGKEIALGPTHEEIVTNLVAGEVRSYKELPVTLYQIQNKFRDEARPRFGVVRSCEFIMKDAYSFDRDVKGLEESYKKMYDAYCRIFSRCGLPYIPVEADPGLMGGAVSHEFMVPSAIGEDHIIVCSACKYAASTEVAAVRPVENIVAVQREEMKEVETPGRSTVADVADFLKVSSDKIVKTLLYKADGKLVAVLIRGDHDANEAKIKSKLKASKLELASEQEIINATGGAMGFSGPVGIKVPIYADNSIRQVQNAVMGANSRDKHLINVNYDRDFKVDFWIDARSITEKDVCPKCGGAIEIKTSIEVGHTFKLGTKYSDALRAVFLGEDGKEKVIIMGCYGIGVNRILASLIEVSNDENGIVWPLSLAPFEVVVIPVNKDDKDVIAEADNIYQSLLNDGLDVVIDDRDYKSPGVKFKDADLIGFPFQIVVGKKNLDNGNVEIKIRKKNETILVPKIDVHKKIKDLINLSRY
ncbi:MAG TPA: proline--tRNA ligase [Candidatus Omnitrophota bacterium]|nr:proline--tRNA ligase [Candidatus Omnitrophota bacterium]